MRLFLFRGLIVIIVVGALACVYHLFQIQNNYGHEDDVHKWMLKYAPPAAPEESKETEGATTFFNQSITELRGDTGNDEIVAWLRVPSTNIDYAVTHGSDNAYYLDHDIRKQHSVAGSIFIDSRNHGGFTDFNTIVYGHNMNNRSMFGDLADFNDWGFFNGNQVAKLYLPEATYDLEIFAFLRVRDNDEMVYGSIYGADMEKFTAYIQLMSSQYREVPLSSRDRIVSLSTCTNGEATDRIVVMARITP